MIGVALTLHARMLCKSSSLSKLVLLKNPKILTESYSYFYSISSSCATTVVSVIVKDLNLILDQLGFGTLLIRLSRALIPDEDLFIKRGL